MELLSLVGKQFDDIKFYLDSALKNCVLSHSHLIPVENLHQLNASAVSQLSVSNPVCVVGTKSGYKVVGGIATYRAFLINKDVFLAERHTLHLHVCSAKQGKKVAQAEGFIHPLLLALDSVGLKALGYQFKVSKDTDAVCYFIENTGINSDRALAGFLNVSRGALFP